MKPLPFQRFTPFSASGGQRLLERATTSKTGKTYRGVTIVKVGRGNKEDNNYYPAETLREAAKQGMFEGLRAFADHPTAVDEHILPERSIRDIVGVYTNTRFKENRIVGDLTVFRKDQWLTSMIDDLLSLEQADKIGISINGAGKTVPKQVRVSESGESQEVNWLESFHILRSADVVTEAGAGGGFQRILESARAARGKSKMKLTKEQQKKLNEATAAGDPTEIDKLLKEFTETNKNGGAAPKVTKPAEQRATKPGAKQTPPKKTVLADKDLLAESDDLLDDDADDDQEEVDHDAELEAVAESIKDEAADDDPDDTDDVEESDTDDTDTEDDPDDEDDADENVEEADANGKLKKSLLTGAKAIRAAAERRKDAHEKAELEERATELEEAARGGKKPKGMRVAGGAKVRKSGRGGRGNLNAEVKGAVSTPGQKKPKTAGARESGREAVLEKKLKEANEKSRRLSMQLSLRQNTDRAKKLLRESSIPEALRPKVIKELINLDEGAMRSRIEYHESLVETILTQVRESAEDDMEFDPIEGAGTRTLRESFSGGRSANLDESFFEEVGLPLKASK